MNERQRAHVNFYLERLDYWRAHRPHHSTARLLAARDADEAHPLRTEEEATEAIDYTSAGSSRDSPWSRAARADPRDVKARAGR